MLRTEYIVYAFIAVEMKPQFLVIVALMATIGLMTAATIAIPMLEDGNGHMQTAHAQIDSSCATYYNPNCQAGWWDNGNWYD
jgi:hypothetical protein